jgi:hypothetical protein
VSVASEIGKHRFGPGAGRWLDPIPDRLCRCRRTSGTAGRTRCSQPQVKQLLSSEHFSVDGTLIQAWASVKSFKPKQPLGDDGGGGSGRNTPADFHGQKRSNETHRSTTDPDARPYRKGPGMEARLCLRVFCGKLLIRTTYDRDFRRQRNRWCWFGILCVVRRVPGSGQPSAYGSRARPSLSCNMEDYGKSRSTAHVKSSVTWSQNRRRRSGDARSARQQKCHTAKTIVLRFVDQMIASFLPLSRAADYNRPPSIRVSTIMRIGGK